MDVEDRTTEPAVESAGRRSVITALATGAARRWRAMLAVLVLFLLLGAYAYAEGLDREGFPPINTPVSVVTGQYFVDDAGRVDADVARPLADAFLQVADVEEVTTESRPNSFGVVVEFDDAVTSEEGTARLRALGLPVPDGAVVDYRAVQAARFAGTYDLIVSVVGPEGVTPEQLEAEAGGVRALLQELDAVEQAGLRELLTRTDDGAGGEDVRLTRFTRVAVDASGYRDAVAIGVVRADGVDLDVLEFSDLVDDQLTTARAEVPDGWDVEITADFASGVRQQLSLLTSNLATGLAAVALVSLLLIGWRVSFVTAGFMALVLLAALVSLWVIGYTLNTITLFGLILTLGLLVDDAIVISESIDASRSEPDPAEPDRSIGVVRTALDRVGAASFAGTLTTVVVFSPLLFVGGVLGEFVRPIPATVIVTLLGSFLFSIVFIPTLARAFLLRGDATRSPVTRAERTLARQAGRLAAYPWGNGWRGRVAGAGLVAVAMVCIGGGGALAGNLGFNIFPPGRDATGLNVSASFPPGTTIDEAQAIADQIDRVVLDVLGDDLVRSQYVRGNERVVETFIDLTAIDARSTTAPTFVERIEAGVAAIDGARVTVTQVENGPPDAEFPFALQIDLGPDPTDAEVAAAQALAREIRADLVGETIDVSGDTVTVTDAVVSTEGEVERVDGARFVEVRAQYDDDASLTSNLDETRALVADRYGSELARRGLDPDSLEFDFGAESDNADDFAALGTAGLVALVLMLVLLAVQFRSVAQPLLIFLAIPFSFLGVFTLLTATGNPLSFLVTVGFIALIGVAVNNTILVIDAANQARRRGASAGEAIGEAIERRFRPLVVTTLTTVVGLLPLSLSDPFWESLGFTLIGGLLSSTFLVVVSFPAFYLALEALRTPLRNAVRRRAGRPTLS